MGCVNDKPEKFVRVLHQGGVFIKNYVFLEGALRGVTLRSGSAHAFSLAQSWSELRVAREWRHLP